MTTKQKQRIAPILAYAIAKEKTKKAGKHYKTEYIINAYDIFALQEVEGLILGEDEQLLKVKITAI